MAFSNFRCTEVVISSQILVFWHDIQALHVDVKCTDQNSGHSHRMLDVIMKVFTWGCY